MNETKTAGMTDMERLEARETTLAGALQLALKSKKFRRELLETFGPEALGMMSASLQNNGMYRANELLWDAIGEVNQ